MTRVSPRTHPTGPQTSEMNFSDRKNGTNDGTGVNSVLIV